MLMNINNNFEDEEEFFFEYVDEIEQRVEDKTWRVIYSGNDNLNILGPLTLDIMLKNFKEKVEKIATEKSVYAPDITTRAFRFPLTQDVWMSVISLDSAEPDAFEGRHRIEIGDHVRLFIPQKVAEELHELVQGF